MIADLHCDLLLYLAQGPHRTPFDPIARCSIPQMKAGGVKLQVLPIYTPTCPDSLQTGLLQNNIFHSLPKNYPENYVLLDLVKEPKEHDDRIAIIRSIENASAFCGESEPLENGLRRLERLFSQGSIAYISLTWNTENRFGGGCHSSSGITEDGKTLLSFMNNRRVAVDLSHTSDRLAYDILDHIDQKGLNVPILASHSNCRAVWNDRRNLPDDLINEIINRKGIIGLNFIKPFLGPDSPIQFSKHLGHLMAMNAENNICFGADFFYEEDIPESIRRPPGEYFYEGFDNASAYGNVLRQWSGALHITGDLRNKIAYKTAIHFLTDYIL